MTSPTIRSLNPDDGDDVLEVLLHDGGYAERVHGRAAVASDVADLFTSRPAGVGADRGHVLGLVVDDALVGVAALVEDHPEAGTHYLGLLQMHAAHQGRGLARTFHELLVARFPHATSWLLSVVDSNDEVVGFWRRMGYRATGEERSWTSPSGAQHAVTMMRLSTG